MTKEGKGHVFSELAIRTIVDPMCVPNFAYHLANSACVFETKTKFRFVDPQ